MRVGYVLSRTSTESFQHLKSLKRQELLNQPKLQPDYHILNCGKELAGTSQDCQNRPEETLVPGVGVEPLGGIDST